MAVLTVSDSSYAGERTDLSGDVISEVMMKIGYAQVDRAIVPDESDQIAGKLAEWCDGGEVDVVLTTGGTGLGSRDVTPEATRLVAEYEVPGIPEAIRTGTAGMTRMAMLSRAVAAMRAGCLIINLPGSPKAVREALGIVAPVIGHAIDISKDRHGHPSK
jgi:molybdenum cofactor synthesis domain-containing protein